jgi:release factor glutamine methyltransferase
MAHPEARLGSDAASALAGWLDRRASGEPIAYIRGFKEWRSLRMKTDPRALIPRPETELLVDAAIKEIASRLTGNDRQVVAWEVATGGGAVASALALRFRSALLLGRLRLVASDLSAAALELAEENLGAHRVEGLVTLVRADLLDAAGVTLARPDVVLSNLPYLTTAEVQAKAGSIAFEPALALDGGPDGLDLIRRLLAELPDRVAPGAVALLEVGAGQADVVRGVVPPDTTVATIRDLAGSERIVRVELRA